MRALVIDTLTPGQALSARFRCRIDGAVLTLMARDRAGSLIADLSGADVTQVGWGAAVRDDARVAEVLVYDRELAADEIQQIERALATRYGVTLSP